MGMFSDPAFAVPVNYTIKLEGNCLSLGRGFSKRANWTERKAPDRVGFRDALRNGVSHGDCLVSASRTLAIGTQLSSMNLDITLKAIIIRQGPRPK